MRRYRLDSISLSRTGRFVKGRFVEFRSLGKRSQRRSTTRNRKARGFVHIQVWHDGEH